MGYEKGEKIRIKINLQKGNHYGSIVVTNIHLKYFGLVTTIKEINNGYRLELDNGETRWAYDMLELIDENIKEEKSISFTDVCDIINKNQFAEFMLKFRDNSFNGTFNKILETLSKYRSSYKALQEGKWYLKGNDKKLTLKSFEESIVGEDAGIVDINLNTLHIGDVVDLYINNEFEGRRVIARDSFGKAFVMGCGGIKIIGGVGELSVKRKYIKIEFSKSYKQFKVGDYVDGIKFVEANKN